MGRPARAWRLALGLLLTVVPIAPAQFGSQELGPVYLDLDTTATIHLQRADASLDDGQWAEGIDVLAQVMQTYGDKLVELSEGRHVNVRTLCQLKIAALPAAALAEYRRRVDGQAAAWYEQAVRERRDPMLKRLVREFFCSSWGDDALWLLGEMALEQGRYWEARSYWERLLPPDAPHGDDDEAPEKGAITSASILSYPDTSFDLSEVRARMALCLVLAGDRAGARQELAALRRDDPDASGYLAGTEGSYVATLSGLLEKSRNWPSPPTDADWPTFAGNAQRNKDLPYTVELGAKVGSVELFAPRRIAPGRRIRWPRPHVAEDLAQPLSYFPALVDGKLVVNNAGQLLVLDPSTCKPLWENSDAGGGRPQSSARGTSARHTVTVHGGRVYATTESPSIALRNSRVRVRRFGGGGFARGLTYPGGQSAIVCWSLEKEGEQLWELHPPEANLRFEGSPVVDEGRF
jgi:tetratricopeptide (TPR) repeat protein